MDHKESQQALDIANKQIEKVTFWGIVVAGVVVVYGIVKDVFG